MGVLGKFSNSTKNLLAGRDVTPQQPERLPLAEEEGIQESGLETTPASTKVDSPVTEKASGPKPRRLSLRVFGPAHSKQPKPALSEAREREKKDKASSALAKRISKPLSSNADKRAKESALIVRTLITGAPGAMANGSKKASHLNQVKSELSQPTSANRVIAQLRTLPSTAPGTALEEESDASSPAVPIHAVCLAHPDEKEHELHFSKLSPEDHDGVSHYIPSIALTSIETLQNTFREMHIVDLVSDPDLGLGQPGDGDGLLAGALPTPETVINGIEEITPQLMALGYATGKAMLPDHKGVHPPTDRMSVLTYWWGLELVLPPPSLAYLKKSQSVATALVNFLTAVSVMNKGVRELLPFVRYISQFIDFEFSTIRGQDKGMGVVCAATWLMPAALVPRPWDFPPPEVKQDAKLEIEPVPGQPEAALPLPLSSSPRAAVSEPDLTPDPAHASRMNPPIALSPGHNMIRTPRMAMA
ncbi:unnamed protein product [Mycena citricolor]|uniref:Uncharacterized protein n=1 Tax=Mycena citricolor TaxID=2018698 RepID=A0AAD2JWG0_9AGAR|nr:unnamed protein product [Mycena citricolor]